MTVPSHPKVSILVPCYNVKEYVEQCLESLRTQTLRNIEILMIDDGSTDGTSEILKQYTQLDPRFKLISKSNSGYGDSMNLGLANAKGEFIGIVESDDFVEPDMYKNLYDLAKKYDLDRCRCGYFGHREGKDESKITFSFVKKNEIINPVVTQSPFFTRPSIWANIYKREWLEANKINFLATPGASYQDTSFNFKANACCRRFMMVEDCYVHYRLDNANNSTNSNKKIFCVCDEIGEIFDFIRERPDRRDLVKVANKLRTKTYNWNLRRIAPESRHIFIDRWHEESRLLHENGELDFSLLKFKEKVREWLILFYPQFFEKKFDV